MSEPNTITLPPSPSDIDIMLADLNVSDTEIMYPETIEELEEPSSDILEIGEDEESELAAAIAKDEIYTETESMSDIDEVEPVAAKPAKEAKEKKERKPRAASPKGPKVERSLEALPAEAFVLVKSEEGAEVSEELKEELKAVVLSTRPTQKKIAEKFDQTIAALYAGRKPSTYVVDCFVMLNKAPGKSMTSSELIAGLKSMDYAEGTASSQVGQIMALFPILGMAMRDKQTLALRDDSVFNEKLAALIA